MKTRFPACFALALGLAALSACVPASPPPVPVYPVFASPPPVALAAPVVVPVTVPVVVPAIHHHPVRVAHVAPHPVPHRHWVRRTVVHTTEVSVWSPGCGSVDHPCDVDHTEVPIQ